MVRLSFAGDKYKTYATVSPETGKDMDTVEHYTVNWCACGSSQTVFAEAYAKTIQKACRVADKLTKKYAGRKMRSEERAKFEAKNLQSK